ncbi:CHAT domain-containing protein [Sinomicrobium pectinilyticum]|uniref:CHAT domain-containing protein n=1 Tax=Sinomicrobium pectinilyticum TaxID=1084421 RepID=UPI001475C70E|nr:CHAT domain-containing tetratricopeptide repeat protein [Sinomicrobium pectinilyticum]
MKKNLLLLFCLLSVIPLQGQLTDSIYHTVDRLAKASAPHIFKRLEEKASAFEKQAVTPREHTAMLILRCNMGYHYRKSGMSQKAIACYESAWKNYQDHQLTDYDIIEYCLKPLGNLYTISGNFTQAENTIKSYLFLAEEQGNRVQRVAAVLNLSVVYHNTGNFHTAIRLLEKYLKNTVPDTKQKALLLNNLATNYFALEEYEKSEAILKQATQTNPEITSPMYRNMAQLAKNRDQVILAQQYLDLAEKAIREQPSQARDIARLYVEKSELSTINGDTAQARKLLYTALGFLLPNHNKNALPNRETLYPENTLIAIFDALASLENDMETSLYYYELSFYVTGLLQKQIISQETKILHGNDNRIRSEKCIDLLYNTYKNTNKDHYLERAFFYAERSKASALKGAISQKSLAEKFPGDSLLLKENTLSSIHENTVNKLVRAQLTGQGKDSVRLYTKTSNRLNLELKSLRHKIDEKYPETPFSGISVPLLRNKLKNDNASMIVYFSGKQHLYIFAFSRNGAELHRKDNTSALREEIRHFISFFDNPSRINNDVTAYSRSAYQVYRSLIPSGILNTEYLVIVPDGLLGFIPFEALLIEPAQSDNYNRMPFLVKRQKMVYQTSADLYLREYRYTEKEKLLGIFPIFESTPMELRYSEEEAESIRCITDADILSGKDATKANFLEKAGNYDIIHLSTHASGGNFVIPANIEFRDDVMLLHELYGLQLKPALVVLSACETGIGKLQRGEGAISLARGFQYAGANRILFSLWKVNDRATSRIMTLFYQNYQKYASASAANHQSKIDYLEDKEVPLAQKSPYYWSGFVYYGNIQHEKLPVSSQIIVSGTIVALLCTALFIEFYRRKKRKRHRSARGR